jgi:iron complex outermembrane receptor protein
MIQFFRKTIVWYCTVLLLFIVNRSAWAQLADSTKTTEIEGVVIESVRADTGMPITQTTLTQKDIKQLYAGQEVVTRLAVTPSITWYSDGGHYTGYSYMRLRGIDQTRINFTLNGVPLNEPEDQGVYFSNYPGFLNSIQSAQIQRGVGISSNGTTSFGGSVNFESPGLLKPRGSEVQLSYGSYNTWQVSPQFNTGLLANKWAFYGRYAASGSDGFREHSGTTGQTFFFSGGYFGKRSVLKLTAFTGRSKSSMSYLAVSEDDLRRDYRLNYLTDAEDDKFQQSMAMVQYTTALNNSFLTTSVYYNYLKGGYDLLSDPDMLNFSVQSNMVGLMVNYHLERSALQFDAGVHGNLYARDHFLRLRPDMGTDLYRNTGTKNEVAEFVKVLYTLGKLSLFADVQLRTVYFRYKPDTNTALDFDPVTWTFLNPKVGTTYAFGTHQVYASLGRTSREPTRNDMFAGADNIDTSNYEELRDFKRVKPESVTDLEVGVRLNFKGLRADVNLYAMEFRNEIAAIGQLSMIGLPLRKNVKASYRRGIELDLEAKPLRTLTFTTNANISRSRIKEYTSDFDNGSYQNIEPLLTPPVVINQSAQYAVNKWMDLRLSTRYLSEAYLDNTNNADFTVDESFLLDGALIFTVFNKHTLNFQVNNLTNQKYFTSGYVAEGQSYYFAMAQRNYYMSLNLKF